jgi:siroheme synthase
VRLRRQGAPLEATDDQRTREVTLSTIPHPLDQISLGKIVQIRERLFEAQARGARVYRLESGDPSFSPPPHVIEALAEAARAGKTHYIPNNGIPELRAALARKVEEKNGIRGVSSFLPDDGPPPGTRRETIP